jgi:hypothetical protein
VVLAGSSYSDYWPVINAIPYMCHEGLAASAGRVTGHSYEARLRSPRAEFRAESWDSYGRIAVVGHVHQISFGLLAQTVNDKGRLLQCSRSVFLEPPRSHGDFQWAIAEGLDCERRRAVARYGNRSQRCTLKTVARVVSHKLAIAYVVWQEARGFLVRRGFYDRYVVAATVP